MIITNWKIMLLTSLHSNCDERYFIDNWMIKIRAMPAECFKAEIRQRNNGVFARGEIRQDVHARESRSSRLANSSLTEIVSL